MPESTQDRAHREAPPVDETAVRRHLARVLESEDFRASRRCQEFLRFVVERTLQGRADDLKERTIGIELLGRPASYDPSTDSTVRVKAGDVRKRLHTYYSGTGRVDEIRIDLPAGRYIPEFTAVSASARSSAMQVPAAPHLRSRAWRWILLAGVVVLGLGLLAIIRWNRGPGPLERFWAAALSSDSPVLLCMSPVPVFGLNQDLEAGHRPPRGPEDFISLPNQFVGGGDVLALGRLTSMFGELRHKYRVRLGNDLSFHDIREAPSVLIGYSYTRWGELNRGLRFVFNTSQLPFSVLDNGKPTSWVLPDIKPDRTSGEDYAIVGRLLHPDTGALLVVVAGITQYGSEAAADLVTNADSLRGVVDALPSGWEKKNLEMVLHVRVISGAPGAPEVVATHVW